MRSTVPLREVDAELARIVCQIGCAMWGLSKTLALGIPPFSLSPLGPSCLLLVLAPTKPQKGSECLLVEPDVSRDECTAEWKECKCLAIPRLSVGAHDVHGQQEALWVGF